MIDRLPGERIAPHAIELRGTTIPRRLAGRKLERVIPDVETLPIARLLSPGNGNAVPSSVMDLFHAGGREAEIEEVFRRILAAAVPLDQVEIACASRCPRRACLGESLTP